MGMERRQDERTAVALSASAVVDGREIRCSLKDISVSGARIAVPSGEALPDKFPLRLAQFGDVDSEVRWRRSGEIGLRFHDETGTVAEIVMGMAMYGL